jgi:hypothetical protein
MNNGAIIINSNNNIITNNTYPILKDSGNNNIINPIVWYKFDTSSNLGLDSSGNNYNLTNYNLVGYNNTNYIKGTGSAYFNGSSSSSMYNSSFATILSGISFSVSYFQYALSTTAGSSVYIGNENYWIGYGINGNFKYGFGGWTFGDIYSSSIYNDVNTWVHVCFTYNISSQSKKIYRNGILIASGTAGTTYTITNNNLTIGAIGSGWFMNGLMDDFRIYNNLELSQSQVFELYNGRVEIFNQNNLIPNVSITGTGNSINIATDNSNYRYAFFANNGTFTTDINLTCDILVVGGGGSGGFKIGGGGGAGAVVYIQNASLSAGNYNVVIGAGGAQSTTATGNKGSNSSFGNIIAEGGGYSVSYSQTFGGGVGGSGGGGVEGGGGGGVGGAGGEGGGGRWWRMW